jgi:16S rRNA processing protein RimM
MDPNGPIPQEPQSQHPQAEELPELVVMGRVNGAYGVKGWVRIAPYSEEPHALLRYEQWLVQSRGRWSPVRLIEASLHSGQIVAHWEGCETRDDAALWRGAEVAVERAALPALAEGQYYWADLQGLQVQDEQGSPLGRVVEVFSNGAHDILRVGGTDDEGRPQERLIPFIDQFVRQVAVREGFIRVDWGRDW